MPKLSLPTSEYNVALVDGSAAGAAKAAGTKESKVLMVPFDSINILDEFNVRVVGYAGYEDGIKNLMASIRENGFYRSHPLSAKVIKNGEDDIYVLNDGHRRFEAVKRLRDAAAKAGDADTLTTLERLPVVLKDANATLADLTVELVTGNSGAPLNPYEKALVVGRLIGYDMKVEDIATRLGMTPRYVNDLKVLLGADEKMIENIVTGKVSGTEAIRLIREEKKGEGSAAEAVEAAAGEGGGKATRAKTTKVKAQKTAKETAEMTFKAEQVLGPDARIAVEVAKFLGMHALLKVTKGGQKAVKGFKVTITLAHKVAVDAPAVDDSGLNNDDPAAGGDADPAEDLNNGEAAEPDAEAAGL